MNPKEQAQELFKSMYNIIFDIDMGVNVMHDKKRFDGAKYCALIAVNQVLDKDGYNNDYWQQVKQKIEKL